ncbi:MAG: hypothetical protein QXU79_01515 [Candidatus Micrarchaeaceae archaeon]
MPDYEIINITEGLRIDERGNINRTRVVQYKIGNFGPFTIEIPAKEFSTEYVVKMIEEEVNKIKGLTLK